MTVLISTTSFCSTCGAEHAAHYEREGSSIWFVIECPLQARRTRVSSDADLFLAVREKWPCSGTAPLANRRRFVYLLNITRSCNFTCPVCYADAGPTSPEFMELTEIERRLRMILRDGGRTVAFSGGEPTLHPNLPQAVRMAKAMGLRPCLATNGLELARESSLAIELKRAGLYKVSLQFDSLKDEVYRRVRGRDCVRMKQEAIEAIARAGLRLGLIATVCGLNIGEVGNLAKFAASRAPAIHSLALQAMLPVGRWLSDVPFADREAIMRALMEQCPEWKLRPGDFFPTPVVPAIGLDAHPDCEAHLAMSVKDGTATPLSATLDFHRLLERWGRPLGSNSGRLLALISSARRGHRMEIARGAWGFFTGRGRRSLMIVSTGGYMRAETRDEGRLARCSSCMVTKDGPQSVCAISCSRAEGRAEGPLP